MYVLVTFAEKSSLASSPLFLEDL